MWFLHTAAIASSMIHVGKYDFDRQVKLTLCVINKSSTFPL
jgi:hypothetical protein